MRCTVDSREAPGEIGADIPGETFFGLLTDVIEIRVPWSDVAVHIIVEDEEKPPEVLDERVLLVR